MVMWAIRSALACALRGRLWLPFVLNAGVNLLLLGALLHFYNGLLAPVLVPIVKGMTNESATHYPNFYLALPLVFSRLELILSILVTCVLAGAATALFAQAFGRTEPRDAWRVSLRRYPSLLIVTALLGVCLFAIPFLGRLVPQELALQNSMVRWGLRGGLLFLSILVQTLFVYAAAWIILRGQRSLPAIGKSLRLSSATLVPTFLLVAIPVVLLYPLGFLTSRGDLFVSKFRPEAVTGLLVLQIALELLLGFVLVGAITRLFLYQTEETQ
jgi:hypothetical protein